MSKGKKDENATMLREYVHRALTNKSKAVDATSYANLVKELSTLRKKVQKEPSDMAALHLLSNMIHALKDCVSALRERKHDALLNEVLGMKLWSSPPIIRDAVLKFIGNLVVVNAAFTHTCLQLLVCSFLPPPAPPQPDVDQGEWKISEEVTMVHSAVLATLAKVLQMVPTAPSKLLQLIAQHMPHKLRDRNTQCVYLSAMLSLAETAAGAPIRDGILATAVEHALSIDVEIRWEDIVEVPTGQEAEEEQSDDDEEQEDIFELEGMTELDINASPEEILARQRQQARASADRGGWEGAAVHSVASTSGRPAVDETANKLDSMMELLFEHLARRRQSDAQTSDVWSPLLSIFERTILNTQRSKFTQFLIFYICSKQPQPCAAAFVDLLLTHLNDARQPAITRSACAAYTASFLARSAFVPPDLILNSLQRLLLLCRQYADSAASTSGDKASGPAAAMLRSKSDTGLNAPVSNWSQHQVFYASVQSMLYILCYQLRSLMHEASSGSQLAAATRQLVQTQLVPLLNHRLAPLLVCLPSVVAEFKHQAGVLGLLDVSSLASTQTDDHRAQRPLEMFFPFDPYLLPRSSRYLNCKESYVRWRHGHPTMHPTETAGAAAEVHGGSDEEFEATDGDEELDEHGGMDDASADEDSSDELEGMSLPSDSILPRPGLVGPNIKHGSKSPDASPGHASLGALHGGAFRGKGISGADDAVMSFSPGYLSSIGDVTPTGMSPVLVNYISPGGASPMQMTPVLASHMEGVPSRLHRR